MSGCHAGNLLPARGFTFFMNRRMARVGGILGLALAAGSLPFLAQSFSVGDGSPTSAILAAFLRGYGRGSFAALVDLPPRNRVHRSGNGYLQDFDAAGAGQNFIFTLAKPDSNQETAFQMCCQILQSHGSIGGFGGRIGYPTGDQFGLQWPTGGGSAAQNFEGGHIIILHQEGQFAGQTFFVRDPYVGLFRANFGLGPPVSQERDTTSRFNTTATQQDFRDGVIVQITSGPRDRQIYSVAAPIFAKYAETGGTTGSFLGYPIGPEQTVSGKQRQNFEGGFIEYAQGQPPEARAPVSAVSIDASPLNLLVGNVVQRAAMVFDHLGTPVERPVSWTTSNGAVITIEATGATAALRAVGAGFANVTAVADGISSGVIRITVTSVCCQPGEGAPTAAITQAMQTALTRNAIQPRLPTDNPVRRMGSGYLQEFTALQPATVGRFLVVKADASALAYLVSGERLTRYQEMGGVVGPLGFPLADANAAGRQLFQNSFVLAGSPAVLIAPPITLKWASLGYEAGPVGPPRSEAVPAGPSPYGATAVAQTFAGGVLYGYTSGPRNGLAYLVSGLILAKYRQLDGPAGFLGLPLNDAALSGVLTQQVFEGGSIDFSFGDREAQERPGARFPTVSVFPLQTTVGGRFRISISGFRPSRRLLVSITNQPDFEVAPPNGAYGWEQHVQPGAAAGLYRITVRDAAGGEAAVGTYRILAVDEARYQLTKFSGDNQTGLPGAELPLPLVVRWTDESNSPLAGTRIRFSTAGGAVVTPAEAVTGAAGQAAARLRLPLGNGLALVTAESGGRVATFSARAEDGRLTSFPIFRQNIDDVKVGGGPDSIHKKGSLLTAAAALLRYYQDRGELPSAAGFAEPATLNQFLTSDGYLPFTLNGRQELVVNLTRALAFVSDAADFESVEPQVEAIRDSVNLRRPVLLGLMLRSGDRDRGAHYVVATGVTADGGIVIYDPSPDWNRSSLGEYLNGFTALNRSWTGRLLHGLRLRLETRSRRGFLAHAPGTVSLALTAPLLSRGYHLRIPALAVFDEETSDAGDVGQLLYSEGAAPQYQFAVGSGNAAVRGGRLIDPVRPGVYRINPDPAGFSVIPQTLTASAEGLRNAAGLGPRLAPGALVSLFGSGFADAVAAPAGFPLPDTLGGLRLTVGNRAARLLFVSPFQANLQAPLELPAGVHSGELTTPFGTTRLEFVLDGAAPGIFLIGPNAGAVLNQDGTINSALNPARRGGVLVVFLGGLGPVAPSVATGTAAPVSPLSRTVLDVTATLDGLPVEVQFAGLAPGFAGLYQVNLSIPARLPPNAAARLAIQVAGQESNTVPVAIQ